MKFQNLQEWLTRAASSRFAPIVLLGVAIFDFLFMILPSDACLAAAILGRPSRTRVFVAFMVLGRVIAVILMVQILQLVPLEWFHERALSMGMENAWQRCLDFFERFGAMALGVTSLTPFPLQFITAISTVSGVSVAAMALSMAVGSLLRYLVVAGVTLGGKTLWGKYHPSRPPERQFPKTSAPPPDSP